MIIHLINLITLNKISFYINWLIIDCWSQFKPQVTLIQSIFFSFRIQVIGIIFANCYNIIWQQFNCFPLIYHIQTIKIKPLFFYSWLMINQILSNNLIIKHNGLCYLWSIRLSSLINNIVNQVQCTYDLS